MRIRLLLTIDRPGAGNIIRSWSVVIGMSIIQLTKIITHFISLIIKLIKTAHSDNQIIGGCKVEFELLVIVYAEDPSWVQVVRRK